ncbi:hypothetical protein ATY76_28465 [Rhizobium sp. R339]|uniref:DUF4435 domain-containing protein n=1 Tax=Rhizobium sp. R339 TaxID=1764273 RepID=UPI000B52D227|nr:DUF4435 domain-containing protein [Rhizobium sp. R339]OWV73909.1 hypothetical protein ATY76_28465 [Rhizobium sp. R339]
MSMLDVHAAALQTINEAHHTFLLKYKKIARKVYGFTEGKEDPMFYRSLIEAILPPDWSVELISCGGREKVVGAYQSFDWTEFPKKRICFFLDRDLTNYIPPEIDIADCNVYVTDGYSIENSIVNFGLCERMLIEVFKVDKISGEEQVILERLFNTSLNSYKLSLTPLMSQILHWRQKKVVAPLNNVNLSALFSVEDGQLAVKVGTDDMLRLSANDVGAPSLDAASYRFAEAQFTSDGNCHEYTRGKYLLWFLSAFLASVHENSSKFCSKIQVTPKMNVTVGSKNLMIYAAPRARCPQTLRSFINDNYIDFIESGVHAISASG